MMSEMKRSFVIARGSGKSTLQMMQYLSELTNCSMEEVIIIWRAVSEEIMLQELLPHGRRLNRKIKRIRRKEMRLLEKYGVDQDGK